MDRFVTRNEKKTGDSAPAEKTKTDSRPNHQKGQPKRKYDEAYLALGFTAGVVGADERPVCVLCLKTLAADSMRPNKLRWHLETKHPKHMNKPLDFFQRKLSEYRQQESRMVKSTSVNKNAQMASFKVAYRIARCKKPHTIAEQLILPATLDMVSVMLDETSAAKLKTIPLSNDTVAKRICDISNDLEDQLVEKLRDTRFALQVDEATVSNQDCLFISYVRFVCSESLREDLLFCKYVQTRATADELFKILDSYLTEHGLKWENCIGFCSDGAQTMAGKRKGLQALIKRVAPEAQWTHCVIHREALASKHLSPELNDVLTVVVSAVNFIKTRPLKARLFSALCEEMGADHTAVLFHSDARWLSRGKVLSQVFSLERRFWLSWKRNLDVWGRHLDEGNTAAFENLHEISETSTSGATTVIPCIKLHLYIDTIYDWIIDPFNTPAPADFSSAEEDQYIEMTSDSTFRLRFPAQTLSEFWLGVEKEYPLIGQRSLAILLPFATSYLCEIRFSAVASLKTKYRSHLRIEHDLRVAVSSLQPHFENMCATKQAHCSH
ncbi:Zinc finger BED domain-containing protein 5 [Labeo rohita]|uniref:Zinc finger BED domain-containing protein 5 n=1 Tax=Labeo rohita TaxID=84645 RepID=A0ABQ8LFC6_LABRO|nr:Zinc finger BED domain-containing protein 5 [Labeo rohita]